MIRKIVLILHLAYIVISEVNGNDNVLVTTPLGKVKGSLLTSRLGKTIYAFRGIRYAKPPINELRFQPPVPVECWEGVYDATKDGFLCPQPSKDPTSEDCLIINVYSTKLPDRTGNPKRPVMVYLHQGGFYSATSVSYRIGPQYLLDQDIVLVTFNYRLGSLGFISTGTKEAPGNNGLKDQVAALKWVKQNIAAFGGDPDSVTLLGCSAGSRSLYLHMLSPMSQGLFHKGIAMSGSPLGSWPFPRHQLNLAKKQARFVGCPDDTPANIINCLKTIPFKELGDSLPKFREFGYDPVIIWSPVIEEDFGQQRFLTDNPTKLVQSGKFQKIPLITGITRDEFDGRASILENETLTEELNDNWEKVAPIILSFERGTKKSKSVSRELRKYYFDDNPIDESQFTNLGHLYSDSISGFAVNRAAKLMAQYSDQPVYYYQFSYQGRYSYYYRPGTNNTVPFGVIHQDDLIYLYYISNLFPYFNGSFPETEMVSKLTTLYANFAKTGNPIPHATKQLDNVNWTPFTLKDQKYLEIGEKLVIRERLYDQRYALWEKLYPLN